MTDVVGTLGLHIHLVDGNVARFTQDDPAAIRGLLDHIRPEHVFTQRQILIIGDHAMTAYPCSAVTRVELIMDAFPDWPFHHRAQDIVEISEGEFRERYGPDQPARAHPATRSVVYNEFEFVNRERMFLEVHLAPESDEQRMSQDLVLFVQQLLTGPSLFCRRRGGGATIMNPTTVIRSTFYPAPMEAEPYVWQAHRLS